jgi:hypothetical protein
MEALWHGFDELTQGYYRRSKLHAVMLRRLLLLATMDPDSDMVKLLFYLMNVYLKCYSYFVNTNLIHSCGVLQIGNVYTIVQPMHVPMFS